MRQEDVREYLDRRPFQPLGVYLSTGAFFDIRQPELAHVSRSIFDSWHAGGRWQATLCGYRRDPHRLVRNLAATAVMFTASAAAA
jgi:hypothetical protein